MKEETKPRIVKLPSAIPTLDVLFVPISDEFACAQTRNRHQECRKPATTTLGSLEIRSTEGNASRVWRARAETSRNTEFQVAAGASRGMKGAQGNQGEARGRSSVSTQHGERELGIKFICRARKRASPLFAFFVIVFGTRRRRDDSFARKNISFVARRKTTGFAGLGCLAGSKKHRGAVILAEIFRRQVFMRTFYPETRRRKN